MLNDKLEKLKIDLTNVKTNIATTLRTSYDIAIDENTCTLNEAINAIPTIPADTPDDFIFNVPVIQETPPDYMKNGYDLALNIKNNWDINKKDCSNLYKNNNSLIYLPNIDVSNIQNAENIFGNTPLTYLADYNYNFKAATNLNNAFAYTNLNDSEVVKITFPTTSFSANGMFMGCNLINIPSMDLSNCIDVSNMFKYCKGMRRMGEMKTGNAKYMHGFIYTGEYEHDEPNLERIDFIDLSSYVGGENNIITGYTDHNKLQLRLVNAKGIGTPRECDNIHFESIPEWGYGDAANKSSLIYSFVTNIFDRKAAGYPICNITVDPRVYNTLKGDYELTPLENKGYKIHQYHI